MIRHSRLTPWMHVGFFLLFVQQSALAGSDLSDAQKKEIVYRMYRDYKSEDFPGVEDISPREAMEWSQLGRVVFVDTREEEEMRVSMLPGAITRTQFLQDPGVYKRYTVVAYCTISYRSGKFAEKLASRGVDIYNLRGGLLAWVLEGGKVYDENGETRTVHVYGGQWDYAPASYETVTFGFWKRLF